MNRLHNFQITRYFLNLQLDSEFWVTSEEAPTSPEDNDDDNDDDNDADDDEVKIIRLIYCSLYLDLVS